MEYQIIENDGVHVVKIISDKIVYANSNDFKSAMIDLILKGCNRLLLDLSNVQFIDSRGLGVFISIFKNIEGNGILGICAANETIDKVFEVTKLNKLFKFYPNRETALRAMQEI